METIVIRFASSAAATEPYFDCEVIAKFSQSIGVSPILDPLRSTYLSRVKKEQKESYMSAVAGFLGEVGCNARSCDLKLIFFRTQNIPAMIDYIITISSLPAPERGHTDVTDKYDR